MLKQKIYEERREVFRNRDMSYYEIPDMTEWFNDLLNTAEEKALDEMVEGYMRSGGTEYNVNDQMARWFTTHGEYDLKDWDELKTHSLFLYNGEIVSRDVFANILYGFIGKSLGIGRLILEYGGTFQQRIDSGKKDDKRDKERIRQGIEMYQRNEK